MYFNVMSKPTESYNFSSREQNNKIQNSQPKRWNIFVMKMINTFRKDFQISYRIILHTKLKSHTAAIKKG